MLKRIELISGYHNMKETCSACSFNGFSNEAQPIYLTVVNYNEKENKITPSFYCSLCAKNMLSRLGSETKNVFNPYQGEEYSNRQKEWQKLWKEIEFEKKIDSKN